MRQRLLYVAIMTLCLSLTISGCSLQDLLGNKKKSSSQTSQKQQPVIAVSLNEEDPNWFLIKKGIEDMANKENAQIKYLSQQSSDKSGSKSGDGSDVLQGAKVLIFQGGNPGIMQTALAKKVPVLAIGQVPAGSKPIGLIAPDQEKVGELMSQALVNKLQEGQVVILQIDSSESGAQERLAGMRLVLSRYPKLTTQTILGQAGSESVAKQGFQEYVQKNPSKIQAVLADTEKMAAQAVDVLKKAQLDKKVILVGGQANIQSLERMATGGQAGDVDIAPYLQGVNASQWAQKILKKESFDVNASVTSDQGEIPAKVIPVKAITPENLAITQKSYAKAMSLAEQDKKTQENQKQGTSDGQAKGAGDSKGSGQKGGSGSAGSGESSGDSSGKMPVGVNKVTERIKTEITREYLDSQGKVIGTEKSANEQVRTVPPEMLKQEQEQTKKSGDKSGDQASK
ncbi:MAG: sugar ABC transporter substrate-binding protein [Desulfitobacteriaceae bacterium]